MMYLEKQLGEWFGVINPMLQCRTGMNVGRALFRDKDILRPALKDLFRAFELCSPRNVKVVLCGQDPYPGSQAHGLSFSSGDGTLPYSRRSSWKSSTAPPSSAQSTILLIGQNKECFC